MKHYISHSIIHRNKKTKIGRIVYRDENNTRKTFDCSVKNLDNYVREMRYGKGFSKGYNLNSLTNLYLNYRKQLVNNRNLGGEGIKTTTYDTDLNWINHHVLKLWGKQHLDSIKANFILDVVKPYLKNPLNYNCLDSAEKIYNQLKRILEFAMEREIIQYFKFPKFRDGRRTEKKVVRPTPSIDEVKKIISVVSPYYKVFLLTLATSGLRANECLSLKWDDVDFDKKQITIKRTISGGKLDEPKTSNGFRTIPIADKIVKELKSFKINIFQLIPDLKKPSEFIFPNVKGSFKDIDICRSNSIYFANKKLNVKFDLQSFRRFYRTEMELIFDELRLNKMILDYRFGHSPRSVAERHYIHSKTINDSENESVNVLANKLY
jgi:integrase